MKRSVVVLISRAPYGRVHTAEGLRAASGLTAGFDEHEVTVAFVDDGIYAALANADRAALDMADHVDALAAAEASMVADAEAIAARGIAESAMADDIPVRQSAEIDDLIHKADRQVTF